ncbi:hypothetical protein BGZ94_010356 [Podila epigama]|nr:hypothetical protein BGZ94_010356 [Podila epigama]
MGGSEKDLELLDDIDSGSEIEGDQEPRKAAGKVQKKKTKKASDSKDVVEPELKNEVAQFMKSLFGGALGKTPVMEDTIGDEDEDEEEMDGNGSSGQEEEGSQDGWETEEDGDEAEEAGDSKKGQGKKVPPPKDDDSDNDSMDDLPQELKEIAAQLENRKQKSVETTVGTKKPKVVKSAGMSSDTSPSSLSTSQKRKADQLDDVKKQISTMLTKPKKKQAIVAERKDKLGLDKKKSEKIKTKAESSKSPLASKSSQKSPGWKLGDGWSKGFEDSDDETPVPARKGSGSIKKQKTLSMKKKANAFKKK